MKWILPAPLRTVAAGLLVLGGAAGCNIFEWTVDEESFDALMADGRDAIQSGDYDTALRKFTAAVDLEPRHAEARFLLAKSAVLADDVDVLSIVKTLTEEDGGASVIFAYQTPTANAIYRVNAVVIDNLEPIRIGEANVGTFAAADVDLDLAIGYTLRGILRLRDTNGDGVIDGNDVSPDLFRLNGGDPFSLTGLDNVPPEDLNDMLDDVQDLLTSGEDLLDGLDGGGIDSEELEEVVGDLDGDLTSYYVNTGVPGNPGEGDNDGDGLTDEECLNGVDDDGDGIVDEDARLANCP